MKPSHIVSLGRAFEKIVSPNAQLYIHITTSHDAPISAMCYVDGIGRSDDRRFGVEADDWETLFELLNKRWREYSSTYEAEIVRKIALEIIRITADRGECTEAALRACRNISQEEIERFLDRAVADANAIASNGPFSVRRVSSNGPQLD